MSSWIKRLTDLLPARKAETAQDGRGLVSHSLYALDDGARIGCRMVQRQFEIVDDRQPLGGHPRSFLGPGPLYLSTEALSQIVQVGQRPTPAVLELSDLSLQLLARSPRSILFALS
jgi:hypothetical protein